MPNFAAKRLVHSCAPKAMPSDVTPFPEGQRHRALGSGRAARPDGPLAPPLAGILLTGGNSRRMGFDKATMLIGGVPCAVLVARALRATVPVAVEVGPGVSGLPFVEEDPPGGGPLIALCSAVQALRLASWASFALVLACDLPLMTEAVLRPLAEWPGDCSVVPVTCGRPQPLCARWATRDLVAAAGLAREGRRSMTALLERPGVVFVDEATWPVGVEPRSLQDADSVADLDRLGLAWEHPSAGTTGLS